MKITEAKSLISKMRENCLKENRKYDDPKRFKKAEALNMALCTLSGIEADCKSVSDAAIRRNNEEWVKKIQDKIYEIKSDPGYGDFGRAWDEFTIIAMLEDLIGG